MTDKVQKIRKEVERLKLCTMDEHMKFYSECAEAEYNALCKVEEIVDSMQEESKTNWLQELQERLDSLSKEDFEKVWAKYSRYGEEGSVDYNKLITMLNDALSKETKESWNKRLSEEHVSEGLEEEIDKYIKDHFTIDKEQLDRLGIEEKDYLYSMDRDDILAMVRHFTNWQKEQMMAKAIDVEVRVDAGGYPYIPQMELYDYNNDIPLAKAEDRYKVILIKEE